MSDDGCDSLLVSGGGHDGVIEKGSLPVCDQTPVLHRPGVEVWQGNLIWVDAVQKSFINLSITSLKHLRLIHL